MSIKPGSKKEVARERRKSLALDRRTTAALNEGSTKGAVKEFGHGTLTPRGLVKRSHLKEHILNILAEKNLRIGAFGKVEAQEDQASWKVRPNAQQSPQVLNLKKRMEQRKKHMTIYTKNATFKNIFKEAEDRRPPPMQEAVMAGTVELVAREVIDKTAEQQHREKKGVWAQLGKPYACFGVPASAIPRDCPLPVPGEMAVFLGHIPRQTTSEMGKDNGNNRRRVQAVKRAQAVTSESLNMQGMLIKLGLQASTRFPREPLISAEALKTTIKFGGCYTVENTTLATRSQMTDSRSRLSFDLSELYDSWRRTSGGSQSVMEMDFSGVPSAPKYYGSPAAQPERPSCPDSEKALYDWKRQFANLRRHLQEKLNKRIVTRSVRRRHCRSCSPFTAEVSTMLISHMEDRGGTKTPIMTEGIWRNVEEKRERERAASAVADPEGEAVSRFYERVCTFVNNQRMDDPLMDLLVSILKELLESGQKLQRQLLMDLCERLSVLEDHVHLTGRMTCLMPILNFICKELRISSLEFNNILSKFGLDWYNTFTRPASFS